MRRLGLAIVETMNVPDELAGLGLLCAASIACGKLARVAIKSDHVQFPNLYGMVAMPQASGKTPGLRPIHKPLIARQAEMREGFRHSRREWMGRNKVARAQIAALEKQAQAGEADAGAIAARIAALETVEDERPIEPVLCADNATSEAIARLLAENGGRLGVFTPDGRDVLAIARGKYSKDSEDFAVWLKAHDGESFAYHRANRDALPFYCDEAVLAVFVAVQPDAMKMLGESRAMRESGFLARWLYAVPERRAGDEYPIESVPADAVGAYGKTIARLLDMAHDTDADGSRAPIFVRLGMTPANCGEPSTPKPNAKWTRRRLCWRVVLASCRNTSPASRLFSTLLNAPNADRCRGRFCPPTYPVPSRLGDALPRISAAPWKCLATPPSGARRASCCRS